MSSCIWTEETVKLRHKNWTWHRNMY